MSESDTKSSNTLTLNRSIDSSLSNKKEDEDLTSILPEELMLQIFQLIPSYNLRRSVSLVNKRWHQISRDPTLLRVLRLSKKAPINIINEYIEQRKLLRVLKASGLELINETIENIVVSCPFLTCLDIGFCDVYVEAILSICQYAHSLRHINLEGVVVDHEMIDLLCTYLPHLEILNLSHCSLLTDQTMNVISTKLAVVKKLNIDGIQNVSDFGVISLCESHSNDLEALWLDGCELSSTCLQAMTFCVHLSLLSLSYAESLSDDVVFPLRNLRNLTSLTIRKATQLTKPAMISMFDIEQSKLTQLTLLDLNECSVIDDEVLGCIFDICGSKLRVLSLHWCWNVTDIGLEILVGCCVNMERLSLIGNHVIKGQSFVNIVDRWSRLRMLNLTNCNQIDDELMNEVARKMPFAYIFDYFGERFGDHQDGVTQYDISRIFEKMPICEHI